MKNLDDAINRLQVIYTEFGEFCRKRGEASESDTRHKIVDRILVEVLGWKHENIKCEESAENGFCDYVLYGVKHRLLVVEAKKSGVTWSIPTSKHQKRFYSLSGVLTKNENVNSAIRQVQLYCNDRAVRYAVATNGYSFIVFKAISDRAPWREGNAIVFHSPKDIESNFSLFYEMFAYENLSSGLIDKHFHRLDAIERIYDRPLTRLSNPDAEYGRNTISSQLQPYVDEFFGDIASQPSDKVLEACYVYSHKLVLIDKELEISIKDEMPRFAISDGFQELDFSDDEGDFVQDLKHFSTVLDKGGFAILMGGIGCGKSTYIKRFLRLHADSFKNKTRFYYINFIGFSEQALPVYDFACKTTSECIKAEERIIERKTLELMYAEEIKILRQTKLFGMSEENAAEKIGIFLHGEINDSKKFTEKSLKGLYGFGVLPVLIFDNVDQLSIDVQIEIFKVAQFFSKQTGCFCLLSMREESYCTSKLQRILTAFVYKKYHISSPSLPKLLHLRFQGALERLKDTLEVTANGRTLSSDTVRSFFEVVHINIFQKYKPILRLIESLSFGNMRLALEIVNNFMTSGATDVSKILSIYETDRDYKIPFHEFVKSVALNEKKYYKEERSCLVNIYAISESPSASHFCALRVLNCLYAKRNIATHDGMGFVDLVGFLHDFEDYFGDRADAINTILKLASLNKHLVELDTRRTDSIEEASSLRITPSGIFYLTKLYNKFVYLDLMWHDTAFNNSDLSKSLVYVIHSNDFADRFKRVESFVAYLKSEEEGEKVRFNISHLPAPFNKTFLPGIVGGYTDDKEYILHRR